jgi:hypothetical protein
MTSKRRLFALIITFKKYNKLYFVIEKKELGQLLVSYFSLKWLDIKYFSKIKSRSLIYSKISLTKEYSAKTKKH